MTSVHRRALGYGSLQDIVNTVSALKETVDFDQLDTDARAQWAAALRSGAMAAQRSHDSRWFDWFADAWRLSLKIEELDVLHHLCGDLSALRPNQVGNPIARLRMRGAIAAFALANLTGDNTQMLTSLARNADRLLWVGDVATAETVLKQHNVQARTTSADLRAPTHCLMLDSLCSMCVATSQLDEAQKLASELQARSIGMPIYQAHAEFHKGMIAVKRFNFAEARGCLDALDNFSAELGSVDAAEEMQSVLRKAWNSGRTPETHQLPEKARPPLDRKALIALGHQLDQAVDRYQPWLKTVLPRFSAGL